MKNNYFILIGLCLVLASPAHAAETLPQIQQKISEKQKETKALEEKSHKLVDDISAFKKDLIKSTQDIQKQQKDLQISEQKLAELTRQRDAARAHLANTNKHAGGLINAAYYYQKAPASPLLFAQNPVGAARSGMVMRSVIPVLQGQASQYRKELSRLNALEQETSDQRAKTNKSITEINLKKENLNKLLDQRKTEYQATEQKRKAQEQELTQLALQAKNLEDLMRKIEKRAETKTARLAPAKGMNTASFRLPPGMHMPVAGQMQIGFGEKDDLNAASNGVTFRVTSGAIISAPLGGIVKFAGPFQKFGRVLIIEHPSGYHSLIAGLGRIDTQVDARLDAGEPVGTAPETGASAQRIYYELRYNGTPINPQKAAFAEQKTTRKRI